MHAVPSQNDIKTVELSNAWLSPAWTECYGESLKITSIKEGQISLRLRIKWRGKTRKKEETHYN